MRIIPDSTAWYRRLRWVKCKNHKPVVTIADFAEKLLVEEGAGILNWALEGVRTIIRSGSSEMPRNELQVARLDYRAAGIVAIESNRGTTIRG